MNLSMASNPSQVTVIQQAIAVLRKFGSDAHVYLPGVGMLNGLQASNYIDSAGTTVGAVDQPVGLALDAAGGLGVDGWLNTSINVGAGWGQAGATYTATGAAAYSSVGKAAFAALGTYAVTFTIVSVSAGAVGAGDNVVAANYLSAPGTYTAYVRITSGTNIVIQAGAAGFTGVVSNISVREVTGIAASQPTTASKPILRRGAVNVGLDGGNISVWSSTAAGAITTGQTDPLGGTSAQTFSGAGKNVYRPLIISAGVVTFAFTLYSPTAGTLSLGGASGPGVLDLVSVSAGWGTYVVNKTIPANDGCAMILNGTLSAITFYRAALFQGTLTAAQIQALGGIPLTTTAPASTALGPYFWQFDGSNDSLSLGGPLFQMADDHCVVAGVKLDAFSVARIIYSQRNTGNTFPVVGQLQVATDGSVNAYYRNNENTQSSLLVSAGGVISLGTPFVLTETKTGSSCYIEVHNSTVATAVGTLPNTGTFVINAAAIGASAENGNNPLAGSLYPIVVIKGSVSEAEKILLKKFVGQMSGVSI